MSEGTHTGDLRERKRLAAMRRIQDIALDLFEAESYDAVTIERIATAADVSPSSVYRYFGTKERIVLWDEHDHIWSPQGPVDFTAHAPLDAIHSGVEALVASAFEADEARLRRRVRLVMGEPSIEAASALEAYRAAEEFGTAISEALGRPHGDLQVQLFSHAVVGAIVGGLHHWYESGFEVPLADIIDRVSSSFDRGFGLAD
jgi:AcrR family transcriptional regulator